MQEKQARAANRDKAAARYGVHLSLRTTLADLRMASALLRLQAANRVLANRRLLREIRRKLKAFDR
jgi:hypothetical protein